LSLLVGVSALAAGYHLGGGSPADADAVIVFDLDLLGLAEAVEVQAALLIEGSALLEEAGGGSKEEILITGRRISALGSSP